MRGWEEVEAIALVIGNIPTSQNGVTLFRVENLSDFN